MDFILAARNGAGDIGENTTLQERNKLGGMTFEIYGVGIDGQVTT